MLLCSGLSGGHVQVINKDTGQKRRIRAILPAPATPSKHCIKHHELITPYKGGGTGGLVLSGIVFAESLAGIPSQPAVVQWIAVHPSKIKGDTKIATGTGNDNTLHSHFNNKHFINIKCEPKSLLYSERSRSAMTFGVFGGQWFCWFYTGTLRLT